MDHEDKIFFMNLIGCAIGISDISWSIVVRASSEIEAIEIAMVQAKGLNGASGMPPHGIHLTEEKLRDLVFVQRSC